MATAPLFETSEKLDAFLESIDKGKYDRKITAGIDKFVDGKVDDDMKAFYTPDELSALVELKDTERDIESRMPVKITRHYFEQARNSKAMQQLIKASPAETFDLAGERGFTLLKYKDQSLGWINHLGNRFNNLYPTNMRVLTRAVYNEDPNILI